MADYITEQERFWAGEFGNDYVARNLGEKLLASNISLFSKILSRTQGVSSIIEFGANIGMNLLALKQLQPSAGFSAIEINAKAAAQLKLIEDITVHQSSIFDFTPETVRDFVLIKGVLIHINPDKLPLVYDLLFQTSSRYICIAEYYNPSPVEVPYRGYSEKLFKRDFAGEMLDRFNDLRLIDYGFVYHRDQNFPQDDITWFLLEKSSR